jgi:hypothetical protein
MSSYRVCFINEIPRNQKLFRCCQRSIIIRSARSPESAIEAAKKRFARLEGIREWKFHAALMEPIQIETKPGSVTPAQRRARRRRTEILPRGARFQKIVDLSAAHSSARVDPQW